MAGINEAAVADELRKFLDIAMIQRRPSSVGQPSRYMLVNARDIVDPAAQVAEMLLDRVLPEWRTAQWDGIDGVTYSRHRVAARRAMAKLENEARVLELLGDDAPELSAAGLHPLVWDAAKGLWGDRHRRDAVNAAARAINARAQRRLGRRDRSEWKLLVNAFSKDVPKPGEPRLRLMDDDGSDTFVNLHEGAGAFARGLFQAIRNPANHEELEDLGEHEGLEQLAAFSILARWVDTAKVITDE